MTGSPEEQSALPESPAGKEIPFLIRIAAAASLVFFLVLMLMFLAGLIWSDLIGEVTGYYLQETDDTAASVRNMFLIAFLTHGCAFSGILLILFRKKAGFYLLGTACLAIMIYQLIQPEWVLVPSAIYFLVLILFCLFRPKIFSPATKFPPFFRNQ